MILSRFLSWCIQRVASLGTLAFISLILVAFVWDRPSQEKYDDGKLRKQITNGQLVYVYYTIFIHILGVLFPIRLCWATRSMIRNLKMVAIQHQASLFRASSSKSRKGSEVGYEESVDSDNVESTGPNQQPIFQDQKIMHCKHLRTNPRECLATIALE
jgi:hypothetical protein